MVHHVRSQGGAVAAVCRILALAGRDRVVHLRRDLVSAFARNFLATPPRGSESHRGAVAAAGLFNTDIELQTTRRRLLRFEIQTGRLLDVHVRLDDNVTHRRTAVTEEDVDRVILARFEEAGAILGIEILQHHVAGSSKVGSAVIHGNLPVDEHPDVVVTAEREFLRFVIGERCVRFEAELLVARNDRDCSCFNIIPVITFTPTHETGIAIATPAPEISRVVAVFKLVLAIHATKPTRSIAVMVKVGNSANTSNTLGEYRRQHGNRARRLTLFTSSRNRNRRTSI